MATGTLQDRIEFDDKATVCKYVVPEGYGVKSVSGKEIFVDEAGVKDSGSVLYYANVDLKDDGKLLTGTSRSIGVVGVGDSIDCKHFSIDTDANLAFTIKSEDIVTFSVYELIAPQKAGKNYTLNLDGENALTMFAASGASPNAYTSSGLALYRCSCE